jgi:hypothetical protein
MTLRIILKNDELMESQSLEVSCPACSAKPQQPCESGTGQQRQSSHLDRRLAPKTLSSRMEKPERLPLAKRGYLQMVWVSRLTL